MRIEKLEKISRFTLSLYWNMQTPFPAGSEVIGIVTRDGKRRDAGVLIRLASEGYMQANAGALRSINQFEVKRLLAAE